MATEISVEDELKIKPEIFEDELQEIKASTTLQWKTEQRQRFLLKLCIKGVPDEVDIKQILRSLLGEKKYKGSKVMNNPSYIYEVDVATGERPANLACKHGNAKVLKILLDDFKVCPARKNRYGDTALHSTIQGLRFGFCTNENALGCIKLIVRNKRVLDILNESNQTALCLAMSFSMNDIAKELMNNGAFIREYLREKLGTKDYIDCPHLKLLEDIEEFIKDKNAHLLQLKLRDFEVKSLNNAADEGYDRNLKIKINNLIRLAMKNDMLVAVKSLLNCGADINLSPTEGSTLLQEAVELQRFDCVLALLDHQSKSDDVIDANTEQHQIHSVALHLALKSGQNSIVEELLKHDVDLFHRNEQGYKLISLMTASQLRSYFDHRVKRGENKDEILAIDLNCLLLKENKQIYRPTKTEMDVLKTIASIEKHRSVLNHPLIRCFLYFKMDRVYWLYYLNFIFYLLFILSFTSFVLPGKSHWLPTDVNFSFTIIFTVILLFREIMQFSFAPSIYFKQIENWLEILIILSSSAVLGIHCFDAMDTWWKRVTSFGILLSYIELMLMIGRHPRLATYITMFFRVSLSVLYFTIWYGPLLLAFSFIFFIFLHDNNESFQTIWNTIFKSVVMLGGEFEADNTWSTKNETNSDENSIASDIISGRVFFILFIFFIVIVLVNLLNALAVSDTSAVKEDAEILTYVSQINFLYRIEITLSGNWVKKFRLSKKLLNRFRLLADEQYSAICTRQRAGVTYARGETTDTVTLPLNGQNTTNNIDAEENFAILDLTIQKRLKFNKIKRIVLVQLLSDPKKPNCCERLWNHLKFLPSFLEILDDSLDMLLRNSKDSIQDKSEFKDLLTKLEKIERDMIQLKHIENKVDSLDIKIKNVEQINESCKNEIQNQFAVLNVKINATENKLVEMNVKLNNILELLSKK